MPWKVAIELNRVMKDRWDHLHSDASNLASARGTVDFWRYSAYAWQTLFNSRQPSFEVLIARVGGACVNLRSSSESRDI